MRIHEEFDVAGGNELVKVFSGNDVVSENLETADPTVLQRAVRFALSGVVKTREQVLKFGGFAIPFIIAYNAGKVLLATKFGAPAMDFFNIAEDTQKSVMESSIPIVLGTSKTLYAGIWITAEKVNEALKQRGGASVVLNDFVSDERS